MKRYKPKNVVGFYQQHNSRILVIFLFVFMLLLILSYRVYQMQVEQYSFFKTESDDNRILVKFISPIRGNIYDRNGTILAENTLTYNLGIIVEYTKDINKTIESISNLITITPKDIKKFKFNRAYTRSYEPVILKKKLTETEVAKIETNSYHLPAAVIMTQNDRFYSYPKEFAHVIGHVGKINKKELKAADLKDYRLTSSIGKIGLEKQYESLLHGKGGTHKIETDAQGRILRTLSENQALPGNDLYLTIDSRLQILAYSLLKGERASLVAIDPNNYEVLAMASTPSYDARLFVDGINHEDYGVLRNSPDRPLFNRSLSGRYPAGSTFKPFLALGGLESNTINERNKINCKGHYRLKNSKHRFRDWKKEGHGQTDVIKAVAESCDVYFYDLAFQLGIDKIHPYLQLFGFGKKTGIDLPFEVAGFIPSRQWKKNRKNKPWRQGDTLNVGIGQGLVQVTPLQLAYATAILANQGKYLPPRLLLSYKDFEKNETNSKPGSLQQVPIENKENWDLIIKSMQAVVHSKHGTARNIATRKYDIAGKTGTAQVITIAQDKEYDEDKLEKLKHDHALFIAFAPIKEPKIAIAVIVENGKHGSTTAAPIAKKIMDKYLLEILPMKERTTLNQKVTN